MPTDNLTKGDRVRLKRGDGDVGTIRDFVEPKPGWHRALVQWDSDRCEQFVDIDKLTKETHVPTKKKTTKTTTRAKVTEPKVLLVAVPHSNGVIRQFGGADLFASTYTEHGICVLCGFSTVADAGNAFEPKHLESVIDQWLSLYGRRGWRFETVARDGASDRRTIELKKVRA